MDTYSWPLLSLHHGCAGWIQYRNTAFGHHDERSVLLQRLPIVYVSGVCKPWTFATMHRNAMSILTLQVSFKINIPNKIDSNWFSFLMLFSCMCEESINAKIPPCSINASCIVRYLLFVIGKFIECELFFYSLSSTVQNSLRSTM